MVISDEHKALLLIKKEENMKLSLALKRTGVFKNIIYLKKTKKVPRNEPTLQ